LFLRHDPQATDRWIETTSRLEAQANAQRIGRYVESELSRQTKKISSTGQEYYVGGDVRSIAKHLISAKLAAADPRINMQARAMLMARTATIWSYNEGAKLRYEDAGVTVMEWNAATDLATCPFCEELDGRRIPTRSNFFDSGDALRVGDAEMDFPSGIDHPPLHPNCRCSLIPVL
jgi:hypothetical protein